jgi:general secretion pathway protein F
MNSYQYQALKKSGQICKGTISAESERQARTLLREQDLIPTSIQPLKQRKSLLKKIKISASDLSLLTRQLATLISAGIPIDLALRGVAEQSDKQNVKQLLLGVCAKVTEGYALAHAMGNYPASFPELYRSTVGAGEQTGKLDVVLTKLADYTETQQATQQKIQQALIYPTLMIIVSTLIISFLLSFVVPKIIEVFKSSGQELPYMTQFLITISSFIQNYGLYLLILALCSGFGLRYALNYPNFKQNLHKFLLSLPGIKYLITTVNTARYIHTFSILFASGVSILETMRVSASLVNNIIIKQSLERAAIRVKEGTSINIALQETTFFGAMAIHLISSGEKSGQLATMMERSALHLDHEVRRRIDLGLTLLEPFIILLMGGVVLFIVLATLLPIFSMDQLV